MGDFTKTLVNRYSFFNRAGFNSAFLTTTLNVLFFGSKDCPYCELEGVGLVGVVTTFQSLFSVILVHHTLPLNAGEPGLTNLNPHPR